MDGDGGVRGRGEHGFVIEIESQGEDVLGKRIQVKSVVRCVQPGTRKLSDCPRR